MTTIVLKECILQLNIRLFFLGQASSLSGTRREHIRSPKSRANNKPLNVIYASSFRIYRIVVDDRTTRNVQSRKDEFECVRATIADAFKFAAWFFPELTSLGVFALV